jgi:hypothetical protein
MKNAKEFLDEVNAIVERVTPEEAIEIHARGQAARIPDQRPRCKYPQFTRARQFGDNFGNSIFLEVRRRLISCSNRSPFVHTLWQKVNKFPGQSKFPRHYRLQLRSERALKAIQPVVTRKFNKQRFIIAVPSQCFE